MDAGAPFLLRSIVRFTRRKSSRAITLSSSSPANKNPKQSAGAGGDNGLANGPSVFNRLYNGLVFTVHLLDLMFYGFILTVSPVKLGEQRPRKSHGRPDVCLLYFLSMEIQVPAIRLINQSGRFGASGSSCSWPCECCSISNVSTVSAAQTDVKC